VNGIQLLDRIDADVTFVSELAAVGCITWPQREHLMNVSQPRDRNDKLLEFLTRRSVADFQKFINVLAKEQSYLVPLLLTDGGETSINISLSFFLLCLIIRCLMSVNYGRVVKGYSCKVFAQMPMKFFPTIFHALVKEQSIKSKKVQMKSKCYSANMKTNMFSFTLKTRVLCYKMTISHLEHGEFRWFFGHSCFTR